MRSQLKSVALATLVGLAAPTLSTAQIIYQPFADTDGTALASASPVTGMTGYSGGGTIQTSAALSYPGIASSGNGVVTAGGRGFLTLDTTLPALSSYVSGGLIGGSDTGTLYISFMARGWVANEANNFELRTGTSSDAEIQANFGTTFGNNFYRAMTANTLGGGIENYADASLAPSALPNVDFIVMRLDFAPGAADVMSVFINQTAEGIADVSNTGLIQFNTIGLARYGGSDTMTVDEIRIGTSFADVAPVPEPSTWALLAGGLTMLTVLARRRRTA